jgi:hypothetical protein
MVRTKSLEERRAAQAADGAIAMTEYLAGEKALRERTARLRRERQEREAAYGVGASRKAKSRAGA